MRMSFKETRHTIPAAVELIDLVQHHYRWFAFRADFLEDRIHSFYLFVRLLVTDINDVQQQIGLNHFFERGFKRFDQAMRQFSNKSDRVSQPNVLIYRQAPTPGGGIERCKQFVFSKHVRAGERVEQRGFPSIGVTDDGSEWPMV